MHLFNGFLWRHRSVGRVKRLCKLPQSPSFLELPMIVSVRDLIGNVSTLLSCVWTKKISWGCWRVNAITSCMSPGCCHVFFVLPRSRWLGCRCFTFRLELYARDSWKLDGSVGAIYWMYEICSSVVSTFASYSEALGFSSVCGCRSLEGNAEITCNTATSLDIRFTSSFISYPSTCRRIVSAIKRIRYAKQ